MKDGLKEYSVMKCQRTSTAKSCVDAELRETQGQLPPLRHFLRHH